MDTITAPQEALDAELAICEECDAEMCPYEGCISCAMINGIASEALAAENEREQVADNVRSEVNRLGHTIVSCPDCHVGVGRPCIDTGSWFSGVHTARINAANSEGARRLAALRSNRG